jgi:hypothetical protein
MCLREGKGLGDEVEVVVVKGWNLFGDQQFPPTFSPLNAAQGRREELQAGPSRWAGSDDIFQ